MPGNTSGVGTQVDPPDLASVSVRFPATDVEFTKFLAYEYYEHFLTPSDQWWFEVAGEELSDSDRSALVPRARVEISVGGLVQTIGYIDVIETRSSREGGTVVTVSGRDWLSPSVDSHIDPRIRFNASQDLGTILSQVFGPFGGTVFATDNIANLNAITGRKYGTPTGKKGKPLKSYIQHQLKPYPSEGCFQFASRVAQRFGVWIWPAVDGQTVIAGTPDFDQDPIYTFQHRRDDPTGNNVIESTCRVDFGDQPSAVLCCGYGGGGEFPKSTLRNAWINPLYSQVNLVALQASYPKLTFTLPGDITKTAEITTINDASARPAFFYDPESHTGDQLDAFARRELAVRMRKALSLVYTVPGHRIAEQPIAVNTVANVEDDRSIGVNQGGPGIHTKLWIISRRFSKRPGTGTRTTVEMIRLNTMVF